MKARIFVLGQQKDENDQLFDLMLKKTFAPAFTAPDALEYHDTVKAAIPAIGKAFSDSDVVLFFAAREIFAQVKSVLCRALGLKLGVDAALLETAKKASSEAQPTEEFALRHAGIPENGVAFGLSDGLDTGFGVHKGRQTIVVLPVAVDRTGIVLSQSVIPFLNGLYGAQLPGQYAEKIRAFALQDRLEGSDTVIALSDTKTTALIRQYLSDTPSLLQRFAASAKGEQRGNTPPDAYAVNLSLTAAEFLGAPYGVAMTNAFYTGDDEQGERVVYLSVTSETENTVREVTSFYGESTQDLMNRCCSELCALLSQVMDIDAGLLIKKPTEPKGEKKGTGKFVVLLALLLAAIAAVCAYGWYFFSQNEYSLRDWLQTYLPAVVREADGTAETTADAPSQLPESTTAVGDASEEPTREGDAATDVSSAEDVPELE